MTKTKITSAQDGAPEGATSSRVQILGPDSEAAAKAAANLAAIESKHSAAKALLDDLIEEQSSEDPRERVVARLAAKDQSERIAQLRQAADRMIKAATQAPVDLAIIVAEALATSLSILDGAAVYAATPGAQIPDPLPVPSALVQAVSGTEVKGKVKITFYLPPARELERDTVERTLYVNDLATSSVTPGPRSHEDDRWVQSFVADVLHRPGSYRQHQLKQAVYNAKLRAEFERSLLPGQTFGDLFQ